MLCYFIRIVDEDGKVVEVSIFLCDFYLVVKDGKVIVVVDLYGFNGESVVC